ncbi:hypothetical protein SARC_16929, partial [Sphaeroforma arctica JP610]
MSTHLSHADMVVHDTPSVGVNDSDSTHSSSHDAQYSAVLVNSAYACLVEAKECATQ